MSSRSLSLLLALAGVSAVSVAQNAPIVRRYSDSSSAPRIMMSEPIPGVTVRVAPGGSVQTVSASSDGTELRVVHGRASVSVDHPASNVQILVDLPGGQTAITKDGLYTFNANTGMVRVLHGGADAFPGAGETAVPMPDQSQLTFGSGGARATELDRSQTDADLIPNTDRRYSGYAERPYVYPYSYAPNPYYSYPYYAYSSLGFYGYGYPLNVGIGFRYYGGFRGGYGGFRGRRW